MLYLTCTTITSEDLAHYGVSPAKDSVSVDCGTMIYIYIFQMGCSRMLPRRLHDGSFFCVFSFSGVEHTLTNFCAS